MSFIAFDVDSAHYYNSLIYFDFILVYQIFEGK